MLASKTTVPVLGVPVASRHLQGVDSLYSIVQMPKGVPVGTLFTSFQSATVADLLAFANLFTLLGAKSGDGTAFILDADSVMIGPGESLVTSTGTPKNGSRV